MSEKTTQRGILLLNISQDLTVINYLHPGLSLGDLEIVGKCRILKNSSSVNSV